MSILENIKKFSTEIESRHPSFVQSIRTADETKFLDFPKLEITVIPSPLMSHNHWRLYPGDIFLGYEAGEVDR